MLISLSETIDLIEKGKILHIAADERLLKELPKGNWIAGTTPFFMTENGGVFTNEKLFVHSFNMASNIKISTYHTLSIQNIGIEAYDHGFSILILPSGSAISEIFAKNAPFIDQLFQKNIAGWVSGYDPADSQGVSGVINGLDLEFSSEMGVAMHIELPNSLSAIVGSVNIFEPDEYSPRISFSMDSFEAGECLIDGQPMNLAEHIESNGINTKLPLVSYYNGNYFNVSIKEIRDGRVKLYAPVFEGLNYKFAKDIDDYAKEFQENIKRNIPHNKDEIYPFSCNCYHNYLYGELEGKIIQPFYGPITFGEIAHGLMAQTLVYISIKNNV